LFGVSILAWDHIITIHREFHLIWRRKKTASAYWFIAIRYGALFTNIPVIIFSFVSLMSNKVSIPIPKCSNYTLVHQVCMLITELVVSVVMILRLYALYGRSARLLWWLIGIATCLTAVA
ncbi:hypothetical protein DFH06DRAFT_960389, partial [Mycena polygramma]